MNDNQVKHLELPSFFKPYECEKLIRIGKMNDGGYLLDEGSLKKTKTLISFGIDHDWSFEEEFHKLTNSLIHSYDGSVGPIFFIRKLKIRIIGTIKKPNKDYFKVTQYWVNLPIKFYQFFNFFKNKKGPNHYEKYVGNNLNNITIQEVFKKVPPIKDSIFLKIDIEGDEYPLLNDIIKKSELLNGLIVEFHEVNKNMSLIKNFIESISLKLVHVHVNNYGNLDSEIRPDVLELSFSKFSYDEHIKSDLPNKADQKNNKDSWSYKLKLDKEDSFEGF